MLASLLVHVRMRSQTLDERISQHEITISTAREMGADVDMDVSCLSAGS